MLSFNLFSQTNGVVANNDCNFLYANYQNQVECACTGFKKCSIKVNGGLATPSTVNGTKVYLVTPTNGSKSVDISVYGIKGRKETLLTTKSFKVISYPTEKN